MKISYTAIGIILVGGLAFIAWGQSAPAFVADEAEVERHWKIVRDYHAAVRDPANYEHDPQTGFDVMSVPDISPSLAYLVAAGEMEYADVVLPEVPRSRASVSHWLAWAKDRNDIWEMTSHASTPFEIKGEQPLHLNIWYDESAHDDIQELIRELEALPADGT